jgi:tetratricopeptide (TPR) repeat protein
MPNYMFFRTVTPRYKPSATPVFNRNLARHTASVPSVFPKKNLVAKSNHTRSLPTFDAHKHRLQQELSQSIRLLQDNTYYAYEDALKSFDKIIKTIESHNNHDKLVNLLSMAYTYKGIALLSNGDSESEVIKNFLRAKKIDPSNALPNAQLEGLSFGRDIRPGAGI